MMKRKDLVQKLREWLKEDGIKFFSDVKTKHGRIDAVWMDGKLPHPVHFREGMQVRNFLRQHVKWNAVELDARWVKLIEDAIKDSD